jgi:hypothetical protein
MVCLRKYRILFLYIDFAAVEIYVARTETLHILVLSHRNQLGYIHDQTDNRSFYLKKHRRKTRCIPFRLEKARGIHTVHYLLHFCACMQLKNQKKKNLLRTKLLYLSAVSRKQVFRDSANDL